MRLFGGWLHATERLQRERYGIDLRNLRNGEYSERVRHYITAIVEELGEYLRETQWKPWKKPKYRVPDPYVRGRRVEELIDVLHFVANLLVLEGVTDRELTEKYLDKLEHNRTRPDHHAVAPTEGE